MADETVRYPSTGTAGDRITGWAARGAALLALGVFAWLLTDLLRHGLPVLSWQFLTAPVADSGRAGGVGPILLSSLLILAVCLAAAVPLGLASALWLAEYARRGGRPAMAIRRGLDVLAGIPSIVFGLFGNALFCLYLGLGYSIAAGGLTLACMVLPIFTRAAEAAFTNVPDDYRRGAAATGMTRLGTLRHLLLPVATPGIVAGLILAIGRALAETAALLFTSGYVTRMPGSLLDSARALSVHIYDLSINVAGGVPRAYGAALLLIGLLALINGVAATLGRRWLQAGVMQL